MARLTATSRSRSLLSQCNFHTPCGGPFDNIGQGDKCTNGTSHAASRNESYQCSNIHAKWRKDQLDTSIVVAKCWKLPKCPSVDTGEIAAVHPDNGVLCGRKGEWGSSLGSDTVITPRYDIKGEVCVQSSGWCACLFTLRGPSGEPWPWPCPSCPSPPLTPGERGSIYPAGSWVVLLSLSLSFICYICSTCLLLSPRGRCARGKHCGSHPRGSVCPAVVLSVGQPRAWSESHILRVSFFSNDQEILIFTCLQTQIVQ